MLSGIVGAGGLMIGARVLRFVDVTARGGSLLALGAAAVAAASALAWADLKWVMMGSRGLIVVFDLVWLEWWTISFWAGR
jgi:hypothetical protein